MWDCWFIGYEKKLDGIDAIQSLEKACLARNAEFKVVPRARLEYTRQVSSISLTHRGSTLTSVTLGARGGTRIHLPRVMFLSRGPPRVMMDRRFQIHANAVLPRAEGEGRPDRQWLHPSLLEECFGGWSWIRER